MGRHRRSTVVLGRVVLIALGSLLLAACSDDVAAPAQRTIELVPLPSGEVDLQDAEGTGGIRLLPPATEEPRATNL